MKKKILGISAIILIGIQFFPFHNNNGSFDGENSIKKSIPVSDSVWNVLSTSCFDCHSNKTIYPWYSFVQPIGWWLNNHVNEGKREINFSEFNSYSLRKKLHKLKEMNEMIEESEMPLDTYLYIHKDATLNQEQKNLLLSWIKKCRDVLSDTSTNNH